MCFSAQASFTTAAVIGTIGVVSVAKAKPQLRTLALTPLFFAFQQAMEGIVWLTLEAGDTVSLLNKTSTYIFVILATAFWPLWIPSVLHGIEENPTRKKWLKVNIGIGCLLAITALVGISLLRCVAEVVDGHIEYIHITKSYSFLPQSFFTSVYNIAFILYLLPTVGSFFISTLRGTWILGAILAAAWVVSMIAFAMAFSSVWCFFGAWASITIYFIVRK